MRQVQLIPAGCQSWNGFVIQGCKSRFAYSSTLAIYVYEMNPFRLSHILAGHERTITGLDWNPIDDNRFASCSADGELIQWRLSASQKEVSTKMEYAPRTIEYNPHRSDVLVVLDSQGSMWLWRTSALHEGASEALSGNVRQSSSSSSNSVSRLNFKGVAARIRWCPANNKSGQSRPDELIVGTDRGSIHVHHSISGKSIQIMKRLSDCDDNCIVNDIQVDPRSQNYVLVSLATGELFLIDIDVKSIVMTFDVASKPLFIAWNRIEPGSFVSVDTKMPVIYHWNVSQRAYVKRIKVKDAVGGFRSIVPSSAHPYLYMGSLTGRFIVYHLQKCYTLFSTQPGHSETIFDCRFHPLDPNMVATGSFDGSIKLWNIRKMEFEKEMRVGGIVYAIAFKPESGDQIIASTSEGMIHLFDVRTGLLARSFRHHNAPSYRLCWNPIDTSRIVSTSSDGLAVVFKIDGSKMFSFSHRAAVFGCDWNPYQADLFCTGCSDGHVRIFDTSTEHEHLKLTFKGHTERVFNTVWSPLRPGVLCSGSDDKTIRIWDMTAPNTSIVLIGHMDRVRALVWHTEVPHILLSGSWDYSIRIWDTRTQGAMSTIKDHHADVYGLTTHPMRPFTVISSSRDSTLRIWVMDGSIVDTIRIRALARGANQLDTLFGSPGEIMACEPSKKGMEEACPLMCGPASASLALELKKKIDTLDAISLLLDFLYFIPGLVELFNIAKSIKNGIPSPDDDMVHEQRYMLRKFLNRATELEQGKCLGFQGVKRSDRLNEAADMMLQAGNIRHYCEIKVSLGMWDAAIAMAPAVSIEYWQNLCTKRAQELEESHDTGCVNYWVAAGNMTKAVQFHLSSREYEAALVISSAYAANCFNFIDDLGEHSFTDVSDAGERSSATKSPNRKTESQKCHNLMHSVALHQANYHYWRGEAIMAAAVHLSTGQSSLAVQKLVRANEIDIAYGLVIGLNMRGCQYVLERMSMRALSRSLYEDACYFARDCKNREDLIFSISGSYDGPLDNLEFGRTHGVNQPDLIPPPRDDLDIVRFVRSSIMGKKEDDAVQAATSRVKVLLKQSIWPLDEVEMLLRPLGLFDLTRIDPLQRDMALSLLSYVGALLAARKGHIAIIPALFRNCRTLAMHCGTEVPVDSMLMTMQEIQYTYRLLPEHAAAKLADISSQEAVNGDTRIALARIKKELKACDSSSMRYLPFQGTSNASNSIVPTGSLLPSGHLSHFPLRSHLDGNLISGPVFYLEDGRSCISLSEALMWADCNPFSPLNTGKRINPY